jgi:hypothetical protein
MVEAWAKHLQPAMMILWTNDPLIKRKMSAKGLNGPLNSRYLEPVGTWPQEGLERTRVQPWSLRQ